MMKLVQFLSDEASRDDTARSVAHYGSAELTDVGLAKEPVALGGGRGRRRMLDLRRRGGTRLAHGVRAMHGGLKFKESKC